MSGNETKQNIQQMEQGQRDFGIVSTAKNLHKKVVNNQLVSQFDAFSVPVKLTMKGQQQYKTFCGGFMYLFLLGFCALLTVLVIFPNGVQLNSQLNVIMIPHDSGDTGQTLFDNTDQIVSFRGIRKNSTAIIGYENVSSYVTLKAYQKGTDNTTVPLQISTDCRQGYEFCLKNTDMNKNAKIFGNYFDNKVFSKYLTFEVIWCNTSIPARCPTFTRYSIEVSISNFYKKKGGQFQEYRIKNIYSISNPAVYSTNVTREQFTTNNKFLGHLSNILPFTKQSYLFNTDLSKVSATVANLNTPGILTGRRFFQLHILPFGTTKQIVQNFDDISDILLFFLSVKETLYILLFVIFIQQYNRNSGLLDVGSSLFYVDDPKTKVKYDFSRGFDVFVACLFHNHPVTKIIQYTMTKMGKTLEDFFPSKAFCAIKLMAKAQQILQQNAFYGNLNELSSMQGEASKKIPLVEKQEQNKNEQEVEMSYFPILPTDCEVQKRQKELKREAFKQFCQANEHLSPQRKNFIYKVLTDNKLKYVLVHEIQKQFKSFLQNVRIQMSDDIYKQVQEEEFSEIKVAVHDTSSHAMTAQNFIRI